MKMQMHVSGEARSNASKCSKGHSCLSDGPAGLCRVVFCINCKILGVLCTEENDCTYKHQLEDRTSCTCPVRLEIYHKYNV